MKTTGSVIQNTNTDDLSERVVFQEAALVQDSEGNITRAYTDRAEVWAKVLPYASNIADSNDETQNRRLYRVTVRYNPDIQPTDRVLWRGRVLEMVSVPYDAESRHIWTVCECRELVEHG